MAEEAEGKVVIWGRSDCRVWLDALRSYPQVILAQGSERLCNLDEWYRLELPALIDGRAEPHLLLEELEGVAAWKMLRGVWRERNRQLVRGNNPGEVERVSREAFAAVPDPRKSIAGLSSLAGVGPATASAVLAAYAPHIYPFFDELVAVQIAMLGPVAFTAKYYHAYAEQLREQAERLKAGCPDHAWTAHDVAQAMWAASGGKARQTR